MKWSLWEYENAYTRFYADCDKLVQASIDSRLVVLLEKGNEAREPYSKPVRDGIFELRSQRGARLLYFFQPERKIVVVLGIIKDQRKLDKSDIKVAIKLKETAIACEELRHVITTH